MRRRKWRKLILLLLAIIILHGNAGINAASNLLVFEEDYLGLEYTDLANTTVAVFT